MNNGATSSCRINAFHHNCLCYMFVIHSSKQITNSKVYARVGSLLQVTPIFKTGRMCA